MDARTLNFEGMVRDHWRENVLAQQAARILDERSDDRAFLTRVLRDYRLKPIRDRDEVRMRDGLDELLDFYGLVELASVARYVPDELPGEFKAAAIKRLSIPEVRHYYEELYPLALVTQLRQRLAEKTCVELVGNRQPSYEFMRFLDLTEALAWDEDAQLFLRLLDDYVIGDISWVSVRHVLERPDEILRHMSVDPANWTTLQRAVQGFRQFMVFCSEFHDLLVTLQLMPPFQRGAWQHQAYWFKHLEARIGPVLVTAVEAATQATTDEQSHSEQVQEATRLLSQIDDLMRGPPFHTGEGGVGGGT